MNLREQSVKEFQELYKKEFDEEISYGEAKQRFSELLVLYQTLLRPTPNELESIKEKKKNDFAN